MDEKIKARWVKALRSGDYTQGNGALLDDGKHCCLGVLCEVQRPKGSDWRDDAVPHFELTAGLDEDDIYILVNANGSKGWSFTDIADYIEEML